MPKNDPEFFLEYKRIEEAAKTARWKWLSVCATIGVIAIVIGIVKIMDRPPWFALVSLIVVSLIGPSGVIQILLATRKKYISKHHPGRVAHEERLDPQRESSATGSPKAAEDCNQTEP